MLQPGQEKLSREMGEVWHDGQVIVLSFDSLDQQVVFTPDDAEHLALTLMRYADEIRALAALKEKAEEN